MYGTANAKDISISFWVKSSLTGTFAVGLFNSAVDRSYVTNYTINSANTWEQKSVTIPGDTTGTWLTTNGTALNVGFMLSCGSTRHTTANIWVSGTFQSTSSQVDLTATTGATFQITGVQLERGSTASSFEYRPYGTELALCQRYFLRTNPTGAAGTGGLGGSYYTTTNAAVSYNYPVPMRVAPTVVRSSAGGRGDTWWVSNVTAESSGTSANVTPGVTGLWQEINGLSSSSIGQSVQYNGSLQLSAEL
jgi:hypothetical protein